METLNLLAQQREATAARLSELRREETALNRAAGLDDEINKTRKRIEDGGDIVAKYKTDLDAILAEKRGIVKKASAALAGKMGQFLPMGRAVFDIEDSGGVFLGWEFEPGKTVAAAGLSGGQAVMFAAALAHALLSDAKAPVIVVEAAEVGPEIETFLAHIAAENPAAQIIAATCFPVVGLAEWDVRPV